MSDNNYLVCRHMGLTRQDFIDIIKEKNLTNVEDVMDETDAGSVCGSCIYDLNLLLEEILEEQAKK